MTKNDKKLPLVSIITANWNGGEIFRDCLLSLAKLKYPNWEMIVIDNGSKDQSEKYFEKIKLPAKTKKLIRNQTNRGFAPANNQAVPFCNGEFVLLLNNDTKVPPNLLNVLVKRMLQDKQTAVLQPKIFLMDKKGYLDNCGSYFTKIGFLMHAGFMEKDSAKYDKEKTVFSAKGACMMIKKEVIDQVGLFDDDFVSYFEESDFCWRVWLKGYKVAYYPKTFIYHKLGYTARRQNLLEVNFNSYKNRICSLIKNLNLRNLILILVPHLVLSAGIATLFLLRGKPKNSFIIFKAIFWNVTNITSILNKRVRVQKMRVISDQALFKRISKEVNWRRLFGDFKRIEEDIKRKAPTLN